jgi:hypothetical protein
MVELWMTTYIQEMTPLPVKASQVKVFPLSIAAHHYLSLEQVTTKVEHNTPLIKVEALDPGLPGHRQGKPKDCSSWDALI